MRATVRWITITVGLLGSFAAGADSSSCYNIQDPDRRAFCLGSTEKRNSYCYNIRDMDWRHYCLTQVDGQRSHCYNIHAKDLKNQCLAAAK